MSQGPELLYGGDGVLEREEYQRLEGERLLVAAEDMAINIEELFEAGYSLDTAAHSMHVNDDVSEREMALSYLEFDKFDDDFLLYDTDKRRTLLFQTKAVSYDKNVTVRHAKYSTGYKREEYFIAFERKLPYTVGTFASIYWIEYLIGGSVKVTVQGNNIDVDDGVEGALFRRQLTQYDIGIFGKEVDDVKRHLEAGHRESDSNFRPA